MKIDAYLRRIGLATRPEPTLAGLTALHRAHLRAVPYEDLDVQLGRQVTTDIPAIYDKIVTHRRGGWCYEMNGILGWALGELGFDVTRATGAVMRVAMGTMAEGNHLVLRVVLPEGLYLADVGFGDGPLEPIRVTEGTFESAGFGFGLARADGDWWRMTNHPSGGAPSFDFNLGRADEDQLAGVCQALQTSEQSPFVQNAVVQRHVPGGLAILRGRVLRRLAPHGHTDHLIAGAGELVDTLARVFDLDLPEAAALWPKIVARHEAVMSGRVPAGPMGPPVPENG
ncbi:MAG: arylamine N-acetyltransferase [Alphaproteobacteria bacterium]|nr:arylamine N-acetyltransferase [Alphaproteobacteria bacterium]